MKILPYIYVEICGIGWVQIFFHWTTKSVRAKKQLFFGFVWSSTSKKDHSVIWWYFLPNNWQPIWQKIDIQFATVYWILFIMHITKHLPICWVELKSTEVEVDHILNPFFFGHGVHNLERIKNILWVRWWSHFFGMRHCSTQSYYK